VDLLGKPEVVLIDLREVSERERHGFIRGSLHAPNRELRESVSVGGLLHKLAEATGKCLLFYCAFGERSAMAVQAAQDAGISTARHIQGGLGKKIGGTLA
jgi:rhodanese-related sulfurtransferase